MKPPITGRTLRQCLRGLNPQGFCWHALAQPGKRCWRWLRFDGRQTLCRSNSVCSARPGLWSFGVREWPLCGHAREVNSVLGSRSQWSQASRLRHGAIARYPGDQSLIRRRTPHRQEKPRACSTYPGWSPARAGAGFAKPAPARALPSAQKVAEASGAACLQVSASGVMPLALATVLAASW